MSPGSNDDPKQRLRILSPGVPGGPGSDTRQAKVRTEFRRVRRLEIQILPVSCGQW
ncbi:hypothetical protein EKH55_1108 [Sinorhizobium alkalisoli]|nr:hypothetical protein EKH55_1108 [Sinorhizobium alkalisoli]